MESIMCVLVLWIELQHNMFPVCVDYMEIESIKFFYDNENEPSICAENADSKLFLAYLTYALFIVFCREHRQQEKGMY